ncbi:1387_t:CDS:2 [Ambispora leptoticha]|uniref:1387_t:CDS:1 n=1 Tax=Ambispora leptoticha TaxID=144679 RepID=A0A9N9FMM7_9GLOM|nr:1387_t:CDS:2 [Ambispora leptoticha]
MSFKSDYFKLIKIHSVLLSSSDSSDEGEEELEDEDDSFHD